jgi:hypothetical protein
VTHQVLSNTYLSWLFIINMKTVGSFVIVCSQVSLSLPWACLTWWALLMLMPTDMSALCVGNVISHSQSWTGTFDMNVVEPGTSYSAGCVDEGFPDQTISDNMVICTHCRNSNVHDHCVWCKPVIIVVLIWCDLRFVKWHCNVPWEFSISESSVQTWLVVQLVMKDAELISRTWWSSCTFNLVYSQSLTDER